MPGRRWALRRMERLDLRLVLLLGIALLPIGLIAMVQTSRVIGDANRRAEETLLARTLDAAQAEREIILRVRGAAEFAANSLELTLQDGASCSGIFTKLTTKHETIAFAGYVNEEGIVKCGSQGVGKDVSGSPIFRDYKRSGAASVSSSLRGAITDRSVIVVTEPVTIADAPAGYVALSFPLDALKHSPPPDDELTPVEAITFNAAGEILTTRVGGSDIRDKLPASYLLGSLAVSSAQSITDMSNSGAPRIYTIAPLLPQQLYAMSIWKPRAGSADLLTASTAIMLPLLMWAMSLAVAYFAVHHLVTRHVVQLRQGMRAFTMSRQILPVGTGDEAPTELREVIDTFQNMTEQIIRDEAHLEDNIHEKDVLLKEVHHRVKNNLQLIASMTNMQMRKTRNEEMRQILRRLQDRVLGLATIHRNLYQASVLSHVRTDRLITELVQQIVRSSGIADLGNKLEISVDPVGLYPDQAVPLSLLVTEAVTNAIKYLGAPPGQDPWIRIRLDDREDGMIRLRIANSLGKAVKRDDETVASGMGQQLIGAFIMQLEATSETTESEDSFELDVTFKPSDFAAENA